MIKYKAVKSAWCGGRGCKPVGTEMTDPNTNINSIYRYAASYNDDAIKNHKQHNEQCRVEVVEIDE